MRGLKLPTSNTHKDYTDLIQQLPDVDIPTLFYLPANIDRALQKTNSVKVINSLKLLTVTLDAGMRFNRDKWSTELTPLLQLWQKLTTASPAVLDYKPINKPDALPVDSFVYLEHLKAHELVKTIHSTIQQLTKIIGGTALLSPSIAAVGTALLLGNVPVKWEDAWETGPSDPYAWLGGLINVGVG